MRLPKFSRAAFSWWAATTAALFFGQRAQAQSRIYLDEIDMKQVSAGWKWPQPNKAVDYDSIRIAGKYYKRGIGTHATCFIELDVKGGATRFHAEVGVDDKILAAYKRNPELASKVRFLIGTDNEIVFDSDTMHAGMPAKVVDVNLKGKRKLYILADELGNSWHDHVDIADAWIEYSGDKPSLVSHDNEKPYILTPKAPKNPLFNGALKLTASAGKPIIYRLPFSGQRPMTFTAVSLPAGLSLDKKNGIITGSVARNGRYKVVVTAQNAAGKGTGSFALGIGEPLLATPPLGWNHWNGYGMNITGRDIIANAHAMVNSGLADYGFSYVNIDDGWQGTRGNDSIMRPNDKFRDMKAIADTIHALGLKAGLYSSPGPYTCGRKLGSYKNEEIDAQTYAAWGYDLLKHDWCSYGEIKRFPTLQERKDPYIKMSNALRATNRDIVLSLCQYGAGQVQDWGREVGGSYWRTTNDIVDGWGSMISIANLNHGLEKYNGPGGWNDPDMLVVGVLGWNENKRKTKLTPDEQYTHISMWSMLAAPMLLGCDLTKLDDFTLSLLTNREVNAINQDTLGAQAKVVYKEGATFSFLGRAIEVWVKPLADGSKAVGVFNLGSDPADFNLDLARLGLKGNQRVRDLWRQKDLATASAATPVPLKLNRHGVMLFKVSPAAKTTAPAAAGKAPARPAARKS